MGREKQFIPLNSRPMLLWSVETFSKIADEVVVVLTPENRRNRETEIRAVSRKVKFANAGKTRMLSLKSGSAGISPLAELVAVHDGARPLVSERVVKACLKSAAEYGASVPAVSVKDTIKEVENGFVKKTPDRNALAAVHTPQCYRRDIFDKILTGNLDEDYSDESQLLEGTGAKIKTEQSDYANIKITTEEDLAMAEALMNKAKAKKPKLQRFGFGYDIHRLIEGRPFIIAGETIKHKKGMLGHSDGDVVIHAICDALLGCVAAGEIGLYFPPTDLTIMGISSRVIAEKVLDVLKSKNARIIQIDATIVAEEPKIKPHYEQMRKNIAGIFGMDVGNVSVKAKSREGLGDIGHGEAVSCYAVASVEA